MENNTLVKEAKNGSNRRKSANYNRLFYCQIEALMVCHCRTDATIETILLRPSRSDGGGGGGGERVSIFAQDKQHAVSVAMCSTSE